MSIPGTQGKGIRFRFFAILFIVFLCGFVVQSLLLATAERRVLLDALAAKGRSLGMYVAKLSQDPLIMRDGIQLDNIVNGIKKDEDVLFSIVIDAKNEIVTSQFASVNYRSPRLKKALIGIPRDADLHRIIETAKAGEEHRETVVPIVSDRRLIGCVVICLSTFAVNRQIMQGIIMTLGTFLCLMLVLGGILYFLSKRFILDPVAELAEAAARLAGGDLSARVGIASTGEVQALIETFNRMSEQLQKTTVSKEYVDNIISGMIDTLIVIAPDGTIKRGNRSLARLLGYEEAELIGKPWHAVLHGTEEDTRENLPDRIRARGFVSDLELLYVTREGKRIPMLFSAAVIRGGDGGDSDIVGVAQDITARKAVAEELIRARETAENASRLKSEFLANMSHEIRTPLNGVLGMTEIVLSTRLNDDQREYVAAANRSAQALLEIIDDILDFSRMESGRMAICEGDLDLRELMESAVDAVLQQALSKRLEVACLIDPALPLQLRGDQARLRQILLNLGNNAVKFTSKGEVLIAAELMNETPERVSVRFSVTDTGIGIPEEKREMIFEGFTQVDGSTTRCYGGLGIGLSLSKRLVGLMSGTMGVESEPGRGSRFWFIIELSRRTVDDSRVGRSPLAGAGSRVLIADPDSTVCGILQRMLWKDYAVTLAAVGEDVHSLARIAAASDAPFRLLIIGAELRDGNGDLLARKIRADDRLAKLAVIALVPFGRHAGIEKLRTLGVEFFVSRPLKQTALLETIAKALG